MEYAVKQLIQDQIANIDFRLNGLFQLACVKITAAEDTMAEAIWILSKEL